MRDSLRRLTLLVPGYPASLGEWQGRLRGSGVRIDAERLQAEGIAARFDVEWIENDGGFGAAFGFGTVHDDVVAAVDGAPGALLVYPHVDLREGRADIVSIVERLRSAGALAVRIEESKLGWEISSWLEHFASHEPWQWHRGAVMTLEDAGALQSCGMHAFSLPDVSVPADAENAGELASVFNVYQLAENPQLLTGQTFSPDADAPRRVVERWPDTLHELAHPCNNPYGVWRLGPAGAATRPSPELALTFVPALRVLLTAQETEAGRPLTRSEVEATRDGAACIAMEHRAAREMERSRGYADLDADCVWEQWQLVRPRVGG